MLFSAFVILAASAASGFALPQPRGTTGSQVNGGTTSSQLGSATGTLLGGATSVSLTATPTQGFTTSSFAQATPSSTPAWPSDIDCITAAKHIGIYRNAYSPACAGLINDCLDKTANTTFIWSKTSCVAGATCGGTHSLNILERCRSASFPTNPNSPHLSYNVYANIVGDCAWAEGGCPITQQKYIDWFYGALSAIGSTTWPTNTDEVVRQYYTPMLDWTKTGDTIPYTNFDDWLHYADAF